MVYWCISDDGGTENGQELLLVYQIGRELLSPSPSWSNSYIMAASSSSFRVQPNSFPTRRRSPSEILPLPSTSKRRNALRVSSMGSLSPYLRRMISIQSQQLRRPLSSTSNSLASWTTSDFLTSKPSALRMTLSSWQVMKEVLWGSKSQKASRTSTSCSAASSTRLRPCLPWDVCLCIQIITKTITTQLYVNSLKCDSKGLLNPQFPLFHHGPQCYSRNLIVERTNCNPYEFKVGVYINYQQMSEEEVAFDDWEAEAEAVVEEVNNQPPPAPEPELPVAQTEQAKEKEVVVDPRQVFLARLAASGKLEGDKYEDYLEDARANSSNTEIRISNQILKNDKDFAQFARSVGRRLNERAQEDKAQELDEGNLFSFVEELLVLLYPQMAWQNMENVKDKLKIVKRARKDQEAKAKKNREKEQREKKQLKADQQAKSKEGSKKEQAEQEDLFDGATFVNSKQVEEEQKKEKPKVEAPKPTQDDDDDDFM